MINLLVTVVIEGTVGSSWVSDMAIDDLSFTTGCTQQGGGSFTTVATPAPGTPATTQNPCAAGEYSCGDGVCIPDTQVCDWLSQCANGADEAICGACTFEHGECGWGDKSTGQYQWDRHSGSQPSHFAGPPVDHTYGNSSGWYVFVDGATGEFFSTAIYQSPLLSETSYMCSMKFWYHMSGSDQGQLSLVLDADGTGNQNKELWTVKGDKGNQWNPATVSLGRQMKGFRMQFESEIPRDQMIALVDDIAVDDIEFIKCNADIVSMECDFTMNKCGWVDDNTDDYDWTRQKGSTMSSGTGPSGDHTTGSGYYLYTEATSRSPGDRAWLDSGVQKATNASGLCFSWWYHMYGADVGTLNLIMFTSRLRSTIWMRNSAQGDEWKLAEKFINSTDDYMLTFEGIIGQSYAGDIAIDDIITYPGPCQTMECDFEYDFCHFVSHVNGYNSSFDWTRGRGATPNADTGPSFDHSTQTNTSYYAYMNSAKGKAGDRAGLISPLYDMTSERCLTFWYHMYGSGIGSLYVYQFDPKAQLIRPSWIRSDNMGDMWWRGTVTLSDIGKPYNVLFEGEVGTAGSGDIAIDDMQISDHACGPPGFCDFESNMCSWVSDRTQKFEWLRNKGGTPSTTTGPANDHTTGTELGYYMYIETSTSLPSGTKARMYSEPFQATPMGGQCFNFWYHMYGANIGELNIYLMQFNTANPAEILLWQKSKAQGSSWNEANIHISSSTEWYLIIEATLDTGYYGDIAVDDLMVFGTSCEAVTTATTNMPTPAPTYPPSPFDCDFQGGWCSWQHDNTAEFQWVSLRGATSDEGTGPLYDHTMQSSAGWYIYAKGGGQKAGDKARVVSPLADFPTDGVCFKYWYYMFGTHVGRLNVYMRDSAGKDTQIWTRFGTDIPDWKYTQLHIRHTGKYMIVMEAVVNSSTVAADIALDDFKFNKGPCPESSSCDFENGWCEFTKDPAGNFDWQLADAATGAKDFGPTSDVTYSTHEGSYLYVSTKQQQPAGSKARVNSPIYSSAFMQCFQFWYWMSGANVGTLNIYYTEAATQNLIHSQSVSQANEWHVVQVRMMTVSSFFLTIEAEVGTAASGAIAVDDVDKLHVCVPPGVCDFELDTCTYRNDRQSANLDWLIGSGETLKHDTAPAVDHTLGTIYGGYLVMPSKYAQPGEKAYLHSTVMQIFSTSGHDSCLQFWYHMKGTHVGTLNVVLHMYSSPEVVKVVWTKTGEQGDEWFFDQIDFTPGTTAFKIIFEGIVGSGNLGDIALDDLVMWSGSTCPPPPTKPPPCYTCQSTGTCIDRSRVCDFTIDCPDGDDETQCGYDCTFETADGATCLVDDIDRTDCSNSGMYVDETSCLAQGCCWNASESATIPCFYRKHSVCGWSWANTGWYQWIRQNATAPAAQTGPGYDHTTSTQLGHYMYIADDTGSSSWYAELVSVELQQASATCELTFWYWMRDAFGGELRVFHIEGASKTRMWELAKNMGSQWNRATVQVSRLTRPFKISITGDKYGYTGGEIALDDVKFESCELPMPSSDGKCVTGEFLCTRKSCVSNSRICDHTDDCGDQSDEDATLCQAYNKCDFENGLCDWNQMNGDDFDWERTSDETLSYLTGPSRDHTTNSRFGYYMLIETSSPQLPGYQARLKSQAFTVAGSSGCTVRFYYHMYGPTVDKLAVYTRTEVGGMLTQVWSRVGEVGDYYERIEIPLVITQPFEVIIEGTVGYGITGDIAIDDISFTPGCQPYDKDLPGGTTPVPTVGPCGDGKWQCADGQCIPETDRCNWFNQCLDNSDEIDCGTCDFEKAMCGWYDISTGLYGWKHKQAGGSTGPGSDHTSGASGYYMHVETGVGVTHNYAALSSPVYGEAASTCIMKFWYYKVGGQDETTLEVYAGSPGNKGTRIWYEYGDNGNQWVQATVQVGRRSSGFNLQVYGTHTNSHDDIAIDDVTFANCDVGGGGGQCKPGQRQCTNGNCVEETQWCDFSDDCGDRSDETACDLYVERCDFQADFCNWTNDTSVLLRWERYAGPRQWYMTGPDGDHTYGNTSGYFTYLNTFNYHQEGTPGRMNGPIFQPSIGCTMRFWYHMFGQDINALNIYVRSYDSDPLYRVWSKTSQQGDIWHRAEINFDKIQNNYQVVIEGLMGPSYQGDIAVDDISFTPACIVIPGATVPPIAPTTHAPVTKPGGCNPGDFYCTDNITCIAANKKCDFTRNCADGSDEDECPNTCDFEMDTCNWEDHINDNLTWVWGTGAESNPYYGPYTDHNGVSSGHFMFLVIADTYNLYYQTASLISPTYSRATDTCLLSFWWFLSYSYIVVEVKVEYDGSVTSLFRPMNGFTSSTWYQQTVGVGARHGDFRLHIALTHSSMISYGAGLDDIQLTDCAFPAAALSCPADKFWCRESLACIDKNRLCDITDDCGDNSDETDQCSNYIRDNFESGLGEWMNTVEGDDFDWTRLSGVTPSLYTGPSRDHTLGTSKGYFLYIETTGQQYLDKAWLVSPIFNAKNDGICKMRFFYHMYGKRVNSLKVYQRVYSDGGMTTVFSQYYEVGNFWKRAEVQLKSASNFQLVIEAVTGNYQEGDIAIDDVSFTPGCVKADPGTTLPPSPTTTHHTTQPTTPYTDNCRPDEFVCDRGTVCVPAGKVCDFVPDCMDESDEQECTKEYCTFGKGDMGTKEGDICNWDPTPNSNKFIWYLGQGRNKTLFDLRPSRDHTQNSTEGWLSLRLNSKLRVQNTAS
ncbi:PREDICTED: MAM and LDL-receptor class A domain-containing protein 2-like [Priapulus caudatus]|uniref:MAM and LDL-receptor class A domain-containing protein 2-like n=1 Tax=Priapulus caudatus TaxID=37621 RepID=A0ABM1F967_PRICU|nr:PREDICTED: MAM and LDL-receptor class A domain-containing protein 2-like [Priapulus caudatus]